MNPDINHLSWCNDVACLKYLVALHNIRKYFRPRMSLVLYDMYVYDIV